MKALRHAGTGVLIATAASVLLALPVQDRADVADVLITDVTIIDVEAGTALPNQDVVVTGTRIVSIAPAGGRLPRAKTRIAGRGKFAIPGVIDAHVHLARFTPTAAAQFLVEGVTAIRDMGTDPDRITGWRRDLARGKMYGPRIARACGPMLEGRGEPRVDRAVAEAARRHRLPLVGHEPPWLTMVDAIGAGQRSFEHAFYPHPPAKQPAGEAQRIATTLRDAGAFLVPTLAAWQPSTVPVDELEQATRPAAQRLARDAPELADDWLRAFEAYRKEGRGTPGWRTAVETATADIGTLHRAGAPVLAGTDTGAPFVVPGASIHDELRLLVEKAGFSTAEALRAATSDSARLLVLPDLGVVTAGRSADLVILNGNPLTEITQTRAIDVVVCRGEPLTRAHLNLLGRHGMPWVPEASSRR